MILSDEIEKILRNNIIANVDLTKSNVDAVPGHDVAIVDITKLKLQLERMIKLTVSTAIGNNKIVVAGSNLPPDAIKRIAIENMLRNDQRLTMKEMTNASKRFY